jgi:hypothetical protein
MSAGIGADSPYMQTPAAETATAQRTTAICEPTPRTRHPMLVTTRANVRDTWSHARGLVDGGIDAATNSVNEARENLIVRADAAMYTGRLEARSTDV